MSPQSGQRGSQMAAGAPPRRPAGSPMCRLVMRGRCALGKNGSAPTLAVPLDRWAAQQAELRRLRAEIAHQGRLLAAAGVREAVRVREATARSDRGGSMSSEAPSEGSSTPPSRPAEADTPQWPREGSTGVGSGAERLVSASGSTQGPEGTPAAPQLAPPRAPAETAVDCGRELWASGEASIVAAPPALQSAPEGRALLLPSRAATGGPVERAALRPSGSTVPRFRDALGRAARAVAAAALPHRFAQGGPRAAPRSSPQQRRFEKSRSLGQGGRAAAATLARTRAGLCDGPRRTAAETQPGHDPATASPGTEPVVLRAALLGQQLRAVTAERWALPAVEDHARAGVTHDEWVARGKLTLLLERGARGAEVAAAFLRRHATTRQGADGVLRLQDADGQWLSKSQFRRRYKHNLRWEKALRRSRQAEKAALVPRQRSKRAQEALSITDIASCIARFARNKWALVCRGAAIGWISMAAIRYRHWHSPMVFFGEQQRSAAMTRVGEEYSLSAIAIAELEAFRQNLIRSPSVWPEQDALIRRAEACQCIFEEARIRCGDLHDMAMANWSETFVSALSLRNILSVDPSELPLL